MGIIAWIIFGGIAGWLASIIMGNNREQGIVGNIVVGIVGAVIGGFIFNIFGGSGVNGFNWYSLLVALIGSIVLLWVMSLFSKHQ